MIHLRDMSVRRPRQPAQAAAAIRRDAQEFCTVTEAAGLLDVSVSTVWRWVDSGKLPAFRVGPKAIRIRRQDAAAAVQPIAHRERAPGMNSAFVHVDAAASPLTRQERLDGLSALDAADRLSGQILKRRRGKPLTDSAMIIREARDERSRRT